MRFGGIPRDVTVVVACPVGGRSAAVAQALSDAGWHAENLTGGAVAWAATWWVPWRAIQEATCGWPH